MAQHQRMTSKMAREAGPPGCRHCRKGPCACVTQRRQARSQSEALRLHECDGAAVVTEPSTRKRGRSMEEGPALMLVSFLVPSECRTPSHS